MEYSPMHNEKESLVNDSPNKLILLTVLAFLVMTFAVVLYWSNANLHPQSAAQSQASTIMAAPAAKRVG